MAAIGFCTALAISSSVFWARAGAPAAASAAIDVATMRFCLCEVVMSRHLPPDTLLKISPHWGPLLLVMCAAFQLVSGYLPCLAEACVESGARHIPRMGEYAVLFGFRLH